MSTHSPAREMSGSRSVHVSDEDQDTIGVGGEVPHEIGTLNAYIYIYIYISVISTFNLCFHLTLNVISTNICVFI